MTLRKISIPFDTRRTQGVLYVPVLSQQEFRTAALRVERVSFAKLHKARPLFSCLSKNSHLFIQVKTTFNQFLAEKDGGWKIVCEGDQMWLGFIPFPDPVQHTKSSLGYWKNTFIHHYRLNNFANLKRLNISKGKVSIFSLPIEAQLQQNVSDQFCSILNLSFLLIVNYAQDKCSLVCCNGPLPPSPFVPILCLKQIRPDVQCDSLEQNNSLAVPFLAGKHSGIIHFPILSLDQWNIEIKKNPLKNFGKRVVRSTLIIFPTNVLFHLNKGLQGLKCVLIKRKDDYFELGFVPTVATDNLYSKPYGEYFQTLLEVVPSRSKNYYLPGNASSSVILDCDVHVRTQKDSDVVELAGDSLFLLASENVQVCGLFYMKGDFELKCTRPTHPNEGFFPIKRLLEQSFSKEIPEKRDRVEEQGETSQKAVEEQRESSKREEEARKTEEARREEEARIACAETLVLFSQQE